MNGAVDAAGDLATGAIYARAVEPHAGEAGQGAPGALCLNCGTALIAEHCHRCGQAAHVHRSLSAIGHDILHGVFHFEGKVWRTLPMLVFRPGELTRRYVHGERARFLSPLALFLFSVFVMAAMMSSLLGEVELPGPAVLSPAEHIAKLSGQIAADRAKLERIDRKLAAPAVEDADDLRDGAADLREDMANKAKQIEAARQAKPGGHVSVTFFKTGWPALDRGVDKANKNPGLALYKLQSSAYKYSWALIPLSVPFVALLFLWRRGHKWYDHAVFVTFSLSFMTLLMTAIAVLGQIGASDALVAVLLLAAPPAHIFAQLRGAYGLGRWSAAWRTAALLVFALVVLIAFTALIAVHGLTE